MKREVQMLLCQYPSETVTLFQSVRDLIMSCLPVAPVEKIFSKMPTYYVEDRYVRVFLFKDHIKIEALTLLEHESELSGYSIVDHKYRAEYSWGKTNRTEKMLLLDSTKPIPSPVLKRIFAETSGCTLTHGIPGIRLIYRAFSAGVTSAQDLIWEDNGTLWYSGYHPFRQSRQYLFGEEINISPEELNQMIDDLGPNQQINQGERRLICSVLFTIDLIDRNGEKISYIWDEEDSLSEELKEFLAFIKAL